MNAPDQRSDRELLQAHVDGDADAFGELFARHRDRLWAVALRTMGNPEDAADGLQDGMIAAFRRAGSFRGEAQVTTWLHRVVVNACLDRIRAAKIRRLDALPDDVEDRGTLVATAQHDDLPDAAAETTERRRRVLDALGTLPPDQRAALVLVDMEGYPVAEVAEMLGCAEGTVKSRCSRGRTRLAGLLADLLTDADRPVGDPAHGNPPPDGPVQPTGRPRGPPAP
ncbi:RNA polymerase sigma factor SigM [Nocardioides KLBMP 9356]|uniref:RNA polymerase sigma factor SigM n=1 Tax=Nocardioides potassii TaxID=2911371 RepID=A0ABS9HDV0_9ACTN|nr:RNA polymerase sigma factor SigM [Nocardioides potassii]MCF6378481.1 RNA polymerase sigma factor SigM [Nocardioides potassii]